MMAPEETDNLVTGLAARHDRELRSHLKFMVGNEADAADLAQETYLRLHQRHPQSVSWPRAYLFRAATNLALSFLARRREGRDVPLNAEVSLIPDEAPLPETQAMSEEAYRYLMAIIGEMPPRQRRVFVLRKFAGKTNALIAAELDLAVSTVEQHIARAMAHCRKRWAELGLDLNPGGTP